MLRTIIPASLLALVALVGVSSAQTPAPSTSTTTTTPNVDLTCPDNKLFSGKLFTDICWDCIFPVRIASGLTIKGKNDSSVPNEAFDGFICSCSRNYDLPQVGVAIGSYMHAKLVDVTRNAYCAPSLGGIYLQNKGAQLMGKHDRSSDPNAQSSFYNYMYYSFPLNFMLDLLVDRRCGNDGYLDFDVLYISPLDPTWNDDELAFFLNLEAVLFSNPIFTAACIADAAKTAAGSQPIAKLFWCAGGWGNLYPFTGHISAVSSPVRESSLVTARVLAALHRRGLAHKTLGSAAMCESQIYPTIPKTQYKLSMFYPVAETTTGVKPPPAQSSSAPNDSGVTTAPLKTFGAHYIGESTFRWGEWRNVPGSGEDFTYDIIRWEDCCLFF